MKEKLAKLINVKSIVTFLMTALVGFLAIRGDITGDAIKDIFLIIISFYFGTQAVKE